MSHTTLLASFSAFYVWLLLVRALQLLAGYAGINTRGWARLTVLGLITSGVLLVRVDGVALAGWAASFTANFSVPFAAMLAVGVWERTFPRAVFLKRDWMAGWAFGLVSGLLLYPFALGLGRFDPYTWGWHFSPLFFAGAIMAGLLLWKQNQFGLFLLLSIIAYRLHLLESTNYWDYIVDPIYCLVSIPMLLRAMASRKLTIDFQRRVDSGLGPIICAGLSFADWFRSQPAPGRPVRRILVILLF